MFFSLLGIVGVAAAAVLLHVVWQNTQTSSLSSLSFPTSPSTLSSLQELQEFEDVLINRYYGDSVSSEWIDVEVEDELWHCHYLQSVPSKSLETSGRSLPVLLLLHGYGTSSTLAWRKLIPLLTENYRLIALDLPGLGRSAAPDVLFHSSTDTDRSLHLYCSFLQSFLHTVGLTDEQAPFVVAHSFGGFLFTHCASRSPSMATRLLLADVPGFFPMNGPLDFLWAVVFQFGLPQSLLRVMGANGLSLIQQALTLFSIGYDPEFLQYWHSLQTSPNMKPDLVITRFVDHRVLLAKGSGGALAALLNLSMPVSLVYGETDNISPAYQGTFLRSLSNAQLTIIPGTGHVPYIHENGIPFHQAVITALTAMPLHVKAGQLSACLVRNHPSVLAQSSWLSFFLTSIALRRMYSEVGRIAEECWSNGTAVTQ